MISFIGHHDMSNAGKIITSGTHDYPAHPDHSESLPWEDMLHCQLIGTTWLRVFTQRGLTAILEKDKSFLSSCGLVAPPRNDHQEQFGDLHWKATTSRSRED